MTKNDALLLRHGCMIAFREGDDPVERFGRVVGVTPSGAIKIRLFDIEGSTVLVGCEEIDCRTIDPNAKAEELQDTRGMFFTVRGWESWGNWS
jgi:hypothetical protein